jgi:hypothetical protein
MKKKTELQKPPASDADIERMWNFSWMLAHRDELGCFGSKVLQWLEEGVSMREIFVRHTTEIIEASPSWNDLSDFERMFHSVCQEGFERRKAAKEAAEQGIGQTRH